jgi:peptide/nickel transport system substrate-binding protein
VTEAQRQPEGRQGNEGNRFKAFYISRRSFLKGAAVTGMALYSASLTWAGCSSRSANEVVVGVEAEEAGFDPGTGRFDETGVLYARTVFDPLATVDINGNVKPYLASSITASPDYTVWTIRLRPNVYFHDGLQLDANALKRNFDRYRDATKAPLTAITTTLIEEVRALDPLTVEIHMSKPWVPFAYWLTGLIGAQIAYPISPKMIDGVDGYGPDHPSGTGPFVFKEWVPNSHFRAVRNKRYWRRGLPYADAIEFRPIVDETQRVDSLRAGTIDIVHSSAATTLQDLERSGFRVVTDAEKIAGEPDVGCILLNHGKPPFDNIWAAKAVAHATDYQTLLKITTNGLEQHVDGPFAPGTPYYPGPTGFPAFDLDKARQAVAMYKQQTGQDLAFVLGTVPSPSVVQTVSLLQNMWQKAGMKVTLDTSIQQSSLISNAIGGKFQAYLWRQFAAVHPDLNYIFWSSRTIYPLPNGSLIAINMAENKDPIIDQALDDARSNPDQAAAAEDYKTVARRFAVDIPYVWLSRTEWGVASRQSVVGWDKPVGPDGTPMFPMITGVFWPAHVKKA